MIKETADKDLLVLIFKILLYISKPGYQLPVSKLSVCLRSAVNMRDVCRSLS